MVLIRNDGLTKPNLPNQYCGNEIEYTTYKVMLCPNNKQRTKLHQAAGVSRFVYNWTISYQKQSYESDGKFISDKDVRKRLTQLKTTDEYCWLNNYSNNIAKQSVKDACNAYRNFFDGLCKYPRFKSKKSSHQSFYVDTAKIKITETHVKLEKLTNSRKPNRQKMNWVKLAEKNRIPVGVQYYNPRVTFDGLRWWLSVSVAKEIPQTTPTGDGVGIDLGIKTFAYCSDGSIYKNINKTAKVRKICLRKKKLQRVISKKYQKNKKGGSYCKTCNIKKAERRLSKLTRKVKNIRHNYLHQVTNDIINRKPMFVVLEKLSVKDMMKNPYFAKIIHEQCFNLFYRMMEYKCRWNNVEFVIADPHFPSSKMCCRCGYIKHDLKLSERVYVCPACNNMIDRDFQASINLKNYRGFSAEY